MKSIIFAIFLLLSTTAHADTTEWDYKLIKEGMFVKCTQTISGQCITWNWVNSEADIKLIGEIKISVLNFQTNKGWIESDGWMTVPENGVNLGKDVANAQQLTYKLTILKEDTYYLWIKGEGDSGSDSINYGIAGVRLGTINFHNRPWSNYRQYTGTKAVLELDEGVHILNIFSREDGVKIKEIRLSIDGEYVP